MSNCYEGLKTLPSDGWSGTNQWFAIFTVPRHEKRVEMHLNYRNIENFLPLNLVSRVWKDRSKKNIQLPLFPSYLFAQVNRNTRRVVLSVPGVIAIVGRGVHPMPLSSSYIESLREGINLGKIQPYASVPIGSRARIRSGVMAGTEGVLLRHKNRLRVVLTLDAIMKNISVEVGADEIELLEPN